MVRSFLQPDVFGRSTPARVASGATEYNLGIMRIELDLAPGVHCIEHAYTNCYVIAADDGITLVDAGFPSTGQAVIDCLAAIVRQPTDIKALLLTHGHFDHVGFSRGLHESLGVPVWVHPDDRRLAAHPYRYRPQQNRRSTWVIVHRSPLLTQSGWVRTSRQLRQLPAQTAPARRQLPPRLCRPAVSSRSGSPGTRTTAVTPSGTLTSSRILPASSNDHEVATRPCRVRRDALAEVMSPPG
jgi:hypothetical protein